MLLLEVPDKSPAGDGSGFVFSLSQFVNAGSDKEQIAPLNVSVAEYAATGRGNDSNAGIPLTQRLSCNAIATCKGFLVVKPVVQLICIPQLCNVHESFVKVSVWLSVT